MAKLVQQSQGSVEMIYLAQAEAINVSGIYHIGVLPSKSEQQQLILDSVVRLCKIYIKLLSSGCVLFSKFHVMFMCDARSATCANISFGEAENKHTIRVKVDDENQDEDLVEAMIDARIELEQIGDETDEEQEDYEMEESSSVARAMFILEVVEAGYPEALAKAALNDGCNPAMVDEGIWWCLEHETDYIEEELSTNKDEEKSFLVGNLQDKCHWQIIDNSVDTLIAKLKTLWTTFNTYMSSSVSDYLSVEHLALILRKLADKDNHTIDRSFEICQCKEGVPNLIICPQSEMYNTVLSIYSKEDDSPLPLSDEVLLCTPCTTIDMLEIFWRRALFSNVNKIHCLVNVDLLDYEVSDKGEKALERHMQAAYNRDMPYRLVVICSTENEYKSRMVAALDKYRIPYSAFDGEAYVKEYVSKRFIVENKDSRVHPASSVDFNRSSVRVVKSWRAGVGKSLFKRNMVAALQKDQGIEECVVSIPLYDRNIVVDEVIDVLLAHTNPLMSKTT
ncbi:RNF213 [Mytilus edulis]|uniref:RNF213 n=1 Tax=Mytilus edulis TaxID=6550 RepID=A0A8S3T5U9_MYTED|nr:RNF213 [Mytilus edulis]